jgi:hypothetical protein
VNFGRNGFIKSPPEEVAEVLGVDACEPDLARELEFVPEVVGRGRQDDLVSRNLGVPVADDDGVGVVVAQVPELGAQVEVGGSPEKPNAAIRRVACVRNLLGSILNFAPKGKL